MQDERLIFIIDMVNGFVKEGALADPSILKIVPSIKKLIKEKKGVVIEVKESHSENSLEFKKFPPHCIKGTDEALTCDELREELKDSLTFYKNSTSAMFANGLIEYILNNPPKEIIITGCCTDICIINFAIPLKNLFNEIGLDIEIIIYKEMVDTYHSEKHNRDIYNNMAFTLMNQSGISIKTYALEKQEELVKNDIRKKVLYYGNKSLMTDFYELTMAQTYFMNGKQDEIAYFDVFFRKNPFNGGYTISGGLDNIIKYIKNFHFEEYEINYLRRLNKFNEEFLNYLKNIKFTGDIYAIPDGTPVFPNEPIITVRANIIEAQLIETALLTCFNHGSLVTTAAKRITNEAKDIPVMEFGARRARGIDSAIEASKYGFIGGCVGTSNTLAGMKYNLPVLGTMAHSLVTEADSEYEAFINYAEANPNNCIFLVDTYDTLRSGIPNAIQVAKDYLIPNGYQFKGIRIDSGDLAYLSKEARKMLDMEGFYDTTICLSNGLNEYTISELLKQGASIDSIGCGDNISASKERVGGVYKLIALEKDGEIIPKIKVSNDSIKTTTPGFKKVYRFYDLETGYAKGDVVTLFDEEIPLSKYILVHPMENWKKTILTNYRVRPLQEEIFKNGNLVYKTKSPQEVRDYCNSEYETLYPEVKRLSNPHEYYVDLSSQLLELKKTLIEKYSNIEEGSYQKTIGRR